MSKSTIANTLPRRAEQNLQIVGEQIRLARLRRDLSIVQIAERASCSELTVIRVEKGTPTVAIGIYLRILFALGLDESILFIAKDDEMGRTLQDFPILNLKEICDSGNIALLTFYEFVWFEKHCYIDCGFLSSLKNHILYNFRLRDNIKQIKDMKKPKIKRINHKNITIKKNFNIKKYYYKENNGFNFKHNKIGLWKTRIPIKTEKKKIF